GRPAAPEQLPMPMMAFRSDDSPGAGTACNAGSIKTCSATEVAYSSGTALPRKFCTIVENGKTILEVTPGVTCERLEWNVPGFGPVTIAVADGQVNVQANGRDDHVVVTALYVHSDEPNTLTL